MKNRLQHPADFPKDPCYAFQGALGAYSQITVCRIQGSDQARVLPCDGFADVFSAVKTGKVDFGVVPVENALTGSIHDNFDLYLQHPDIEIVAEYCLRIQHNLIALPDSSLEQITQVYSHVQGLLQCTKFLDIHAAWQRVPHFDTAGSVAFVRDCQDLSKAAIASSLAAEIYGMKIIVPGIETNDRNYTRFAMIRSRQGIHKQLLWSNQEKASIVFGLPDRPGSLLHALQAFSDRGFNLKKIESRPIHGRPFEYMFYVDIELSAPANHSELVSLCKELSDQHGFVRILGVYPIAGDQ
jgi:prephenate dehydratase